MKWIVRISAIQKGQSVTEEIGRIADAPDHAAAEGIARRRYGDRPGLRVQSAIASTIADEEYAALVKRQPVSAARAMGRNGRKLLGYVSSGEWLACETTGCTATIRRRKEGLTPRHCARCRKAIARWPNGRGNVSLPRHA